MTATACRALAVGMLLLATNAAAQKVEEIPDAVLDLIAAKASLEPAQEFFELQGSGKEQVANERARADAFQRLRQAFDALQRTAGAPIVGDTLESVQSLFTTSRLRIPRSIPEGVDICEQVCDAETASMLTSTLAASLNSAIEVMQTEHEVASFIVDEPDRYGPVASPTNGRELLKNLKTVLDRDALVHRDFYPQQNLKRFFGARDVSYSKIDGSIGARWLIKAPDAELAKLGPQLAKYAECEYSARLHPPMTGGKRVARLRIECGIRQAALPTIEEVEQVFGKEWQVSPLPSRRSWAASSMRNSTSMLYNFGDESFWRYVEVIFEADGSFVSFRLEVVER